MTEHERKRITAEELLDNLLFLRAMKGNLLNTPVFVYDNDRAYSLPLVGAEFENGEFFLFGETP